LYLSESEGANFWLGVLSDLQNRGIEDILIASVDGLTGFPEAIQTIYPNTEVQLCVVHQIRNSLRYVGSKHHKAFMIDLKRVYQALNKQAAETALDELRWLSERQQLIETAVSGYSECEQKVDNADSQLEPHPISVGHLL